MSSIKKTFIAAIAALIFPLVANAGIVVNIAEVGGNVVLSYGAGTLDTTGLNKSSLYSGCGNLFTGIGNLVGGGAADNCTGFVGDISVSQSIGWTQTGTLVPFSSILGTGGLIASNNYGEIVSIFVGNDPAAAIVGLNSLNGVTGTISGMSFASLGLAANEFISYAWAADSLTFSTGGYQSVPEPSALILVGLGLAGIGFTRRKKV